MRFVICWDAVGSETDHRQCAAQKHTIGRGVDTVAHHYHQPASISSLFSTYTAKRCREIPRFVGKLWQYGELGVNLAQHDNTANVAAPHSSPV
jgi:hypothetical protein